MRKTALLSTVALVAGIGLASAQAPGQGQSGSSNQVQSQRHEGGTAQQTREQAGQGRHEQSSTQGRSEQGSTQNMPGKSGTAGQAQSQRNEGNAQRRPQTTGQNQEEKQPKLEKQKQQPASRAEGNRERTTGQGGQPSSQPQQSQAQQKHGQPQQKQDQHGQQAQQPQPSPQQGQTTTGANTQQPARQGSGAAAQQTGGRASNATVTLNENQRTHIQQTVFTRPDVPRVERVNFNLAVGTVVPEHVRVVAVSQELVEIRPEWRDDMYFVTGDDIVIVDHSHRIVAIVAAGPTTAMNSGTYGSYASARGTSVNMSADEIRKLQIALNEKGFNLGNPDGVWGPRTREALISFQRQQGFRATGQIDQETMAALGVSGHMSVNSGNMGNTTGGGSSVGQGSTATPSQPGQAGSGNLPGSRGGQARPNGSSTTGQGNQSGMPSSSTSGQGGGSNQPGQSSRTQGSGSTNLPGSQSR